MKFKKWEIALAIGMLVCVLASVFSTGTQAAISGKMIRLHVLANSDSVEDQQLKLFVRDRVLAEIGEDDSEITPELLQRLEQAAQAAVYERGFDYGVRLSRERMYFDTRHYDGFSLPAGYYDAVRVLIGEGKGQNWWCVIFPPLCAGVCEAELDEIARQAGLSDDEIAFIRGDGSVYIVRFKIAEILGKLLMKFQ